MIHRRERDRGRNWRRRASISVSANGLPLASGSLDRRLFLADDLGFLRRSSLTSQHPRLLTCRRSATDVVLATTLGETLEAEEETGR
jgi:hypothetical protein